MMIPKEIHNEMWFKFKIGVVFGIFVFGIGILLLALTNEKLFLVIIVAGLSPFSYCYGITIAMTRWETFQSTGEKSK